MSGAGQRNKAILAGALGVLALSAQTNAATFAPDPVLDIGLTVQITEVATPKASPEAYNLASPVVVDGALHIVDQFGEILRERPGGGYDSVFDLSDLPAGVTAAGNRTILNIADGPGDTVFVAFTSDTLPDGLGAAALPDDPLYASPERPPQYQLIYRMTQAADGQLGDATALAAFEVPRSGHEGGGLLAIDGGGDHGQVLFATGDGLGFDRDGLGAPQDPDSHLSKLLLIDGTSGDVDTVGMGVRNVQRLTYTDEGEERIAFADIGARTAEEINSITLADLIDSDPDTIVNFGWGRNADGNAREGTFYIDQGATAVPGTVTMAIGEVTGPEDGFLLPYAQFGRDGPGGIAVSGPAVSSSAFESIAAIFGDLVNGGVYATLNAFGSDGLSSVYSVTLVDAFGNEVTLGELANGRADPRFFTFADGGAGVLLESTGTLYRLSDVAAVIPLPAGLATLLTALMCFAAVRRWKRASV